MWSFLAALRVAHRASRHGVPPLIATYIAFAARKFHVRYALNFALFEQESNFAVIYGHDAGGLFPGREVTRDNYAAFRKHVVEHQGGGSNGVGLGQVTYWTYVRDHKGLWKPRVQVYLATSILADLLSRHDEFTAVGAYNGGEGNPNRLYAEEVLAKARRWRTRLRRSR